jgi:myo-inositol-1(or 4)-monophosphatase
MSNNNIMLPSEEQLSLILATAQDAAHKAGKIILANSQGAEITKTKANSKDLLTLIDPMCEAAIKETVLKQFPNHGFLGEEDVPPGKDASAKALAEKLKSCEIDHEGFLWIVDPIDGTSNFVHGMPLCMPSIACA